MVRIYLIGVFMYNILHILHMQNFILFYSYLLDE